MIDRSSITVLFFPFPSSPLCPFLFSSPIFSPFFPLLLLNLPLNTFQVFLHSFLPKIWCGTAVRGQTNKQKTPDLLLLLIPTSLAATIPTNLWFFHWRPAQWSYSGQSWEAHGYSCCILSPAAQLNDLNISGHFLTLFLWYKY